MGFKEDYLKFKEPSQERENFVFNSITRYLNKDHIEKSMKPITVKGPNNTEITYKVMPDYVSIQGMRVPMSGMTAQRVANHFGFSIPSAQLSQKIYENADVKVQAKPLSGRSTVIDGKTYSGKDVVSKGVGYADFAAKYNDDVNRQLQESGAQSGDIVAGFAKDVVTSPVEGRLGLHGFYDSKGRPIQGGDGTTPHDTKIHSEYGAFVRLVNDEVEVKHPNGEVEKKKITDVINLPTYTISDPSKPTASDSKKAPTKPEAKPATKPAAKPVINIEQFLQSLSGFSEVIRRRRMNIIKRAMKRWED